MGESILPLQKVSDSSSFDKIKTVVCQLYKLILPDTFLHIENH